MSLNHFNKVNGMLAALSFGKGRCLHQEGHDWGSPTCGQQFALIGSKLLKGKLHSKAAKLKEK